MSLEDLETTLLARRTADPAESYTARLLTNSELTQRKIMEEAFEVCLELGREGEAAKERLAEEAADVLYHLMVALVGAEVPFAHVLRVLEGRRS